VFFFFFCVSIFSMIPFSFRFYFPSLIFLPSSPLVLLARSLDCLGRLGDGVLCEVRWQRQAHRGLDLRRADRALAVRANECRRLRRDLVEHVQDEGVEDLH